MRQVLMLMIQWSTILKLPETILFSRMAPLGTSIRSPSFAMMITVPFNVTSRPNQTFPLTVRWSSSRISGIPWKRLRNSLTLSNWLPSLTRGVVGKDRRLLNVSVPFSISYRLDMRRSKSEVFLTGRKRDRGTLMPQAPLKFLIAAPKQQTLSISIWELYQPLFQVGWHRFLCPSALDWQ